MSAAEWVPQEGSVADLRRAAADCRGCELWEPATQVVFSAGNPRGRLMLVGEQPGDSEDLQGIPFVGPAGKLLQRALDEAGADRAELYVTNAVKHFRFTLRGKRRIHQTPDRTHIVACRPWLQAEFERVAPALTVCLGATAAKALLGAQFRVTRDGGRVIEQEVFGRVGRFLATIHPSAILRTPDEEREAAYRGLVTDLQTALVAARESRG